MKEEWSTCRNLLCVRADNLGDVIMSSPAMRSLKKAFGCKITLLTSSMGVGISSMIDCIDDVIQFDAPWVRSDAKSNIGDINNLVEILRERSFDGVIIFSVFSQNPLPAAFVAYMAGIPRRLAYCRENPYDLLTDWLPDPEPYSIIRHQVERDLKLVEFIGAVSHPEMYLNSQQKAINSATEKLIDAGVDLQRPWIILHPGVSETKRQYPIDKWASLASELAAIEGHQIVITGVSSEQQLANSIVDSIRIANGGAIKNIYSMVGVFTLEEFVAAIGISRLVLSVNTGTIHIAAALKKPVVVLYAMTNPQHTPWSTKQKVFYFPVSEKLQSKNEVLRFVQHKYQSVACWPTQSEIVDAVKGFLR